MLKLNFVRLLHFSLPLVLFLLISIFLWKGLQKDPRIIPSPLIDHPLPEFHLPSLQQPNQIISNTEFLNQITLLNVWASWCASCRMEHALLLVIAQSKQIVIYGLDYKDPRRSAIQWLKDYGNPYKAVIYDAQGHLGIDLGVYGTPETFLIDQKGIIRFKYVGPITVQAWQEILLPKIASLSATSLNKGG